MKMNEESMISSCDQRQSNEQIRAIFEIGFKISTKKKKGHACSGV